MIPIFYSAEMHWANTGQYNLDKLGVRPLTDALSCIVTKDVDGIFELTLELPVSNREMPTYDSVIKVDCGMEGLQLFTIYRVEKSLSGQTYIFTGWHVSYINNYDVIKALSFNTNTNTASSGLSYITGELIYTNFTGVAYMFGGMNDTTPGKGKFEVGVDSARNTINAYAEFTGYHMVYDNYAGTFTNENPDNGVIFITRKNIIDLSIDTDISEVITGYYPYFSMDGQLYYNSKIYTIANNPYAYNRTAPYDMNDHDVPEGTSVDEYTEKLIMENALKYLKSNILESITLDAADIGDKFVDVYDQATIICPELGINVKKIVSATEYDVLAHRLLSVNFGEMKPDITKTIALGSSSRSIGTGRKI